MAARTPSPRRSRTDNSFWQASREGADLPALLVQAAQGCFVLTATELPLALLLTKGSFRGQRGLNAFRVGSCCFGLGFCVERRLAGLLWMARIGLLQVQVQWTGRLCG